MLYTCTCVPDRTEKRYSYTYILTQTQTHTHTTFVRRAYVSIVCQMKSRARTVIGRRSGFFGSRSGVTSVQTPLTSWTWRVYADVAVRDTRAAHGVRPTPSKITRTSSNHRRRILTHTSAAASSTRVSTRV